MRVGRGVAEYFNGEKYNGSWESDKKNGRGRLIL